MTAPVLANPGTAANPTDTAAAAALVAGNAGAPPNPGTGQAPAGDGQQAPASAGAATGPAGPATPPGVPADGVRSSTRSDPAPQAPTTTAAGAPAAGEGTDGAVAGDLQGAGRIEDLPPWAQREIRHARQGEETKRLAARELEAQVATQRQEFDTYKAKQEQVLEGVARLFGLVGDDQGAGAAAPPDPEKLATDLSDVRRKYTERTVELAVHQGSSTHGADPARLLDSREFVSKVHGLDPDAADFPARVAEAIQAAVAANPIFKAAGQTPAPPPPPSGATFSGRPAGTKNPDDMSVDELRARRRELRQRDT